MNLKSQDKIQWGESLEDFKPEYTYVQVKSPIECYRLIGKRTTILLDNFEPIPDLHYALYSPQEKRYYLKEFPDLPMWLMLFYKTNEDWDSYDTILNDFRRRVSDGNIFLLLTKDQVADTTEKLVKLYNANLNGDGKLDYRVYIEIVRMSLQYENYVSVSKTLVGFNSVCKGFDEKLAALWKLNVKNK